MSRMSLPMVLALVGGLIAFTNVWPDRRYAGYAAVGVAEDDAGNAGIENIFENLTQKVVGRVEMTQMIESQKLYPDERKTVPMEDLIETCRRTKSGGLPCRQIFGSVPFTVPGGRQSGHCPA
jgi:hypothetical protein